MKLKIASLLTITALSFSAISNLAMAQTAPASDDVEFRKILTGFLADRFTPDEMAQVIYATPKELTVAPDARDAQDFINKIDQIGREINPASLYQDSVAQKVKPYAVADLTARLRAKPLTIVIFPGVFGEFIHNRAFEEVFHSENSTAALEFKARVKAMQSDCGRGLGTACDFSTSLPNLRLSDPLDKPFQKYMTMDQYMHVASIDDAKGTPLVRVVLFATEGMSLETLGTNDENAIRFTRRLEKYFKLMGEPDNMAFMGYSRGTIVALETLAYNKALNKSWLSKVRGMISLGGVNYGTALADEAFDGKSSNSKLISGLETLLASLKDYDEETLKKDGFNWWFTKKEESIKRAAGNIEAINKFVGIASTLSNKNFYQMVTELKEQEKGTDVKSAINLMVEQVAKLGILVSNGGTAGDAIALAHRRVKILCKAVIAATREMQTSERLKWWATHALPLNVRYYAIAGTMGDGLTDHPLAFNPDSADDRMLVGNYSDYKKASGVGVNDSQVAMERVRFWPELNAKLNPANAGLKSEFLGVVGTHHWGLALAVVNVNKNGSVNPFPRVDLLKALATKISSDLITEDAAAAQK